MNGDISPCIDVISGAKVAVHGREQTVSIRIVGVLWQDVFNQNLLWVSRNCVGRDMKRLFLMVLCVAGGISFAQMRLHAQSAQPAVEVDARESAFANAVKSLLRPNARPVEVVPTARWDSKPAGAIWTQATLSALKSHGAGILKVTPRDIDVWCPAYVQAGEAQRAAFWTGLLSALAKHESTYRADAVGGGGKWYGLLQILPATARGYQCRARTGQALKDGAANLSCAVRIMAHVIPRDQAVAVRSGRWLGLAADWGPMQSASKRKEMAAWTREQSYCQTASIQRPRARSTGSGEGGSGNPTVDR